MLERGNPSPGIFDTAHIQDILRAQWDPELLKVTSRPRTVVDLYET